MRFLIPGCNGMAGHTISLYLQEQGHEVTGFAREKSEFTNTIVGDVRDFAFLKQVVQNGRFDAVVNCVGLLNRSAEENHAEAMLLNGYLPHYLAEITEHLETQIIQISTDCVFSGERGGYTETDVPDGRTFYDRSKAIGELDDRKNVTLRCSIVGPDLRKTGIGLLNWFMMQKGTVNGFTGAVWTGQTTLQLAKTVEEAARRSACGLYNAVPDEKVTKYELLNLFNRYIRRIPAEIVPVEGIRADKSLVRTRYEGFDYEIPGYETMIRELGEWIRAHRKLYPHYDLQETG